MNNDLLGSSNKKQKKIDKHNSIYNTNEKKTESPAKINFESYEKNNPINNSKAEKILFEDKKINQKDNINNYLNDYYSNEQAKNINKGQNMVTVNDILGEDIKREISLDIMDVSFNHYFPGKVSRKSYGPIKAYAANTNQGISRDYNEDRVSIIININKNINNKCKEKKEWPKVSYFSVFDGHGGNKCAEFLKNNLLTLICENKFYPNDIEKAIKLGFNEADKTFLKLIQKKGEIIDNSGSCGLILLVVENKLWVANVGDSRCVISLDNGKIRKDVTRDHKPNYPYEKERILLNGGKVYQTQTYLNPNEENNEIVDNDDVSNIEKNTNIILLGPYRVSPGNLSVSRTIGDPAAKLSEYGGNEKVVISEPDIYCFDLNKDDIDFLILGCDGIYDQLTSQEILECAWMMIEHNKKIMNEENKIDTYNTCANIVDFILKMSMARKSFDNVTCLIVAFKDLLNKDNNKINFLPIEETKNNDIKEKNEEKLPNLVKNKTITLPENFPENKKHKLFCEKKIHLKDVDKNNKILNIKNVKIYHMEESRNRNHFNNENLSQLTTNNSNFRSKESKISENEGNNDFLKYKHKLALSLKKAKQNKKYDIDNNIKNNYFINKNSGGLSVKNAKLNLNDTKNFLNNKIKPLIIENKFLLNNNKFKNNLTLKLNPFNASSDKSHIKTENFFTKSPTNINELNYIQNYNSKEKNQYFINKPQLRNINNLHTRYKDKLFLNDLLNIETGHKKNNRNIRLKTMNKKSISFYNKFIDDITNNKAKNYNKHSFQKEKREKLDILNIKTSNGRNDFMELKGQNTTNLKYKINLNWFQKNNGERVKLSLKPGLKGKYLIHNLTEDFLIDNKKLELSNIRQKK